MQSESGRTTSIWMATTELPPYPALTEDLHADVCVIGAGITGMTTAYLLGRAGKRVAVLDDGPIGGGETSRTTAHCASEMDDFYCEIEKAHGAEGARIAYESHSAAINQIESITREEGIDCDFERLDGYLFLVEGDTPDTLDEELDAARRAGFTDAVRLERAPIGAFDTGPCLRFPRQGQFHPLKYLIGLARAIERDGGRLFTGTHVKGIEDGSPARVTTGNGRVVTADSVVVATNSPISDRFAIHTKQAPYRTYVIGARVPRDSVTRALYWDTGDPYHYVRLQRVNGGASDGHDVLIVGGEDHKTGQEEHTGAHFGRLERWTRERFPMAQGIDYRWSGQVMEPVDYMGFIGRDPAGGDNVYIATGDSGQGMTHGTIAGILLTDLILGRDNPWAKLYDPGRISISRQAAGEFAKENINVAAQYTDWVTPAEVSSPDEIKPGTGAVLRRGMTKVAVYRDESGVIHERSAVCAHLGCIVGWNPTERTWDCPCHGSRYDPYGKVLNGPAVRGLGPA